MLLVSITRGRSGVLRRSHISKNYHQKYQAPEPRKQLRWPQRTWKSSIDFTGAAGRGAAANAPSRGPGVLKPSEIGVAPFGALL